MAPGANPLPSRHLGPALAAAALTVLTVLLAPPWGADAGAPPQVPCQVYPALCPDLFVDPVKMKQTVQFSSPNFSSTSCSVREGHVPSPGVHRLLRFTFTTPNIGPADLYVGAPWQHPEWFVYAPCHDHYHFREYADYRLWKPEMYAQWVVLRTALPTMLPEEVFAMFPQLLDGFVAGNKGGFCVIDLVDYAKGLLPANYRSCGNQGISVGWADEYYRGIDGQWIVVDNVPSGDYILEAEVNAERLYQEVDYLNNASGVPVKV